MQDNYQKKLVFADSLKIASTHRYAALILNILVALLYFLAAHWSLLLSFPGTNASPVWPPSGLAVASVFLLGYRVLPAIFVGAFMANMSAFGAHMDLSLVVAGMSMGIAFGNMLEALTAYFLLRYLIVGKSIFANPEDVFKFMGIVLASCVISAGIGTANLILGGIVTEHHFVVLLNWWLGDVAGMVIIIPLLLAWLSKDEVSRKPRYQISPLLTLAVFSCLCWVIFGNVLQLSDNNRLLVYLIIPATAFIAFFFSLRMVSLASFMAATIAIFYTINNTGPFALGDTNSSLMVLVSFMGIYALTGLVLSADLTQRFFNAGLSSINTKYSLISWGSLMVFLGITFAIWHFSLVELEVTSKNKFVFIAQEVQTRIEETIGKYRQMLRGGLALFAASEDVTRQEWQSFYGKLGVGEYHGVMGFAYGKWVTGDEKNAYLTSIWSEGMDTFKIFPAGEREVYVPVTYYEPLSKRSQRAMGYDMFSETLRREAILKARDTGEPTITPKLDIMFGETHDSKVGFIMYTPMYKSYFEPALLESRRRLIKGFIYSVFLMPELMKGMLGNHNEYLGVEIFDGKVLSKTTEMYRSDNLNQQQGESSHNRFTIQSPLYVQDRLWTIQFTALPKFYYQTDRQKPQFILISGLLISLLFFMLVRVLANTRETALSIAKEMTEALRFSEAKTRSLTETANEAIIVNDENGIIISWNRAASDLFNYSEDEIVGQDFTELIPSDHRASYHELLDKNSQGSNGATHATELWGQSKNGLKFPIELSYSSWQDNHQRYYGMIIRDIRFRKYAEESLRASEAKFRSTLEHAPIGMAIVSLTGRWSDVNKALCQMLGYNPAELAALTFQDITHPDDLNSDMEKVQALLDGSILSYQMEKRYFKKSGDIVWVMMTATLMRNENNEPMYFISQIEDITAKKQADTNLKASLTFNSAILSCASQMIVAVNTDGVIVSFNHAAENMLQYKREEVLGKLTPVEFHDAAETAAHAVKLSAELGRKIENGMEVFLAKANIRGMETNEWTYIRKDGSRFPGELTVTTMLNELGEVTGYVGIASDISDRKQKEEIIRQSLSEKETLLKEVYHRVKNNMQVITSLFNIQLRGLPDGVAKQALLEASQRVIAMSLVHEKLYQSKNLDSILLDIYIRELCQQLSASSGMDMRNIKLKLDLQPVVIRLDKAVPLGLILNELITNSLKHAFTGMNTGEIAIKLYQSIDEQIHLTIADNGVGQTGNENSVYSLGMKLVNILASQLDADIEFSYETGTKVSLVWQV